ncbi:MAG: hypothetical protein GC155_16760 [Alphaproteobacteria bacterium]|nr:hypothetical protein [Alphaproteobacteria bacterium]
MLEAGLIFFRFLHLATAMIAFGAAVFPYYARAAPRFPMRIVTGLALLSGFAWFASILLNISGDAATAFRPDEIRLVLLKTGFGRTWLVHLSLSLALFVSATAGPRALTAATAALSLAALAGIGHAAAGEGAEHLVRLVSQGVHLLSAGLWLGGLVPLWRAIASKDEGREQIVRRFTSTGYAAVALVVLTGLINTWLVTGSFLPSPGSVYGRILLIKIALVAGLVAIALFNQFYATRRSLWPLLRRGIAGELAVFTCVLIAVAWLGVTSPAS